MAVDFPSSPVDGEEFTAESVKWRWDANASVWVVAATGVSAGYLPLEGGTITGSLVVSGTTTTVGTATAQALSVFEAGLLAQANIGVETADYEVRSDGENGYTFTSANGAVELGRIVSTGGQIVFKHGVAGTTIGYYTGSKWIMALDMDVTGNLAVTGNITAGNLQEFFDATEVGSWKIVGTHLECWGVTPAFVTGGHRITFPKTFAAPPTVTCGVQTLGDPGLGMYAVMADTSSTTACDLWQRFTTGTSVVVADVPAYWHAFGEWDGAS